ncbi:polyphosphate kinase 2 [Pseudoxanthomonas sp.]|uniref:polyphosphate kinase 2 n=1 Tax=Pseudoxanthomonas sp. TaxID=1871049 RepID=UPI002619A1A6|nr:polyphosphate kinase 2 [Pseudoxanthomonas sp.]WDS35894.1 MAG: polyphosphate kinase 2 [Pseudoxanthomonas sp.]
MSKPLKRKDYQARLEPLQLELVSMARWLARTGRRIVVIFEGRDTAGKGGSIDAIREYLNPRQCKVLALPKPSDREATQWYFQRYVPHLPAAGELLLMDRSWYNRAGVEKVMDYCTPGQYAAFLQQAPVFEQLLVDDGILLFKYWLTVDQKEQEARFAERLDDPLKRWKLSPVDLQARAKYDDYTQAREAMLAATHSHHAPWTLVDFNDQRRGRLTLIRDLLSRLPDTSVPESTLKLKKLGHPALHETFNLLKPIPDGSNND